VYNVAYFAINELLKSEESMRVAAVADHPYLRALCDIIGPSDTVEKALYRVQEQFARKAQEGLNRRGLWVHIHVDIFTRLFQLHPTLPVIHARIRLATVASGDVLIVARTLLDGKVDLGLLDWDVLEKLVISLPLELFEKLTLQVSPNYQLLLATEFKLHRPALAEKMDSEPAVTPPIRRNGMRFVDRQIRDHGYEAELNWRCLYSICGGARYHLRSQSRLEQQELSSAQLIAIHSLQSVIRSMQRQTHHEKDMDALDM
jgi:hypothetical protein